ncbi:sel1 repeat family protein [bacterium]|nr:sel1 repeat family protein [bacterium]
MRGIIVLIIELLVLLAVSALAAAVYCPEVRTGIADYYARRDSRESSAETEARLRQLANREYSLGERCLQGKGAEQDYAEAARWFKKAAEQGLAEAQSKLGNCYYEGVGVEQDSIEAVKWYKLAAEQGDADAQNNLGYCFYYGIGIYQDRNEADKLWEKALKQGHLGAINNYGDSEYYGNAEF